MSQPFNIDRAMKPASAIRINQGPFLLTIPKHANQKDWPHSTRKMLVGQELTSLGIQLVQNQTQGCHPRPRLMYRKWSTRSFYFWPGTSCVRPCVVRIVEDPFGISESGAQISSFFSSRSGINRGLNVDLELTNSAGYVGFTLIDDSHPFPVLPE